MHLAPALLRCAAHGSGGGIIFFFAQGIVVGFLIAAPVGPVGLLCIRRALADGRGAAFVAGLGAAVADTFYGAVAGLGLTLVSDLLMEWRTPLSLVGAAVLLALGVQAWRTPIRLSPTPQGHFGLLNDFVTTLCITLTNPATIIAFMAVFASVGAVRPHDDLTGAGLLIAGVFVGSALWWLTLSALAGAVRHRFSPRWLDALSKGSAALLMVSGVGVAVAVAWQMLG
ncbi:LysE family translocator [Novispirillum sp. DQ9]|uniref:LysE family translocator n=1 Tax=Novispirillum sp. DQ9 TaxID=3398612 RepID=UPI003C7A0D83